MKKLSRRDIRKELRRNEMREALAYLKGFLSERRENAVLTVIVAVVAIGGIYIYTGYQRSVKEEAAGILRDGTRAFQAMLSAAGDADGDERQLFFYNSAVDNFTKLCSGYSGEELSGYARLYLGNCHFYAAEHVKAIKEYGTYLREFPTGIYGGLARKNMAYCYKANGQLREAAEGFKGLLEEKQWGVSEAECTIGLASVYRQMGRTKEADKLLDGILRQEGDSYWKKRLKAE